MSFDAGLKVHDEAGRLAALRRYEILDTNPEKEFRDIVALVKTIFDIQFVAVNLIDFDRQWTLAAEGGDTADFGCAREDAFCDYTIRHAGPLNIPNAMLDHRFNSNPYVLGEAHIRSYLGVPLTTPDGYNIGALCVFDTVPRRFSDADAAILDNFAKVVMSQFELRLVARVDSLTGMLTRRAFIERMDAAQQAATLPSLLLLDIDHFKCINDTHGHGTGDLVLRQVSNAIASQLRKSDCLGRLGGEEFGVLLEGLQDGAGRQIAERIRKTIAALQIDGFPDLSLTISSGLSTAVAGESAADWIERTDAALYASKNAGRNRCTEI